MKLTKEQMARLCEGKPVEVRKGEERWNIGIDLQQRSGVMVVWGGKHQWHMNVETMRQTTIDAAVMADTPEH